MRKGFGRTQCPLRVNLCFPARDPKRVLTRNRALGIQPRSFLTEEKRRIPEPDPSAFVPLAPFAFGIQLETAEQIITNRLFPSGHPLPSGRSSGTDWNTTSSTILTISPEDSAPRLSNTGVFSASSSGIEPMTLPRGVTVSEGSPPAGACRFQRATAASSATSA